MKVINDTPKETPKENKDVISYMEYKYTDMTSEYQTIQKEQYVFPEIEYDNVDSVRGMDIIFVTSAKSDEEARELLNGFDFPFNQ